MQEVEQRNIDELKPHPSNNQILSCIKKQIPNYGKISKKDMEWHGVWGE